MAGTDYPTILHARDSRRGDLVVACNPAAHNRGVRLKMPLAEAAALAEHGGQCLILPHDPAADLAALARLAEHCERFSPLVGWQTVEGRKSKVESRTSCDLQSLACDFGPSTGPDCLFLDVTGIGVLFGREECLAQEVIADLRRLNYEARVAVGDTIGAAWALAKYEGGKTKDKNMEAIASYPSSFILCPSSFLPLESLRLPPETVDLLAQLGIVRLEDLFALPRESLRARFGERLLLRIDQFLGTAQEMIVPHRPPPQFADEWLLEYPAEKREAIEQIVRELIHRVTAALANRREGVLKLIGRLDCAPGRPVFFEVGLFRPSADEKHLWDLLRMQLEQVALPGLVGRVRLEASITAPLENRQGELFAGGRDEAERQLALFIDRCSSRLGPNAVLRPELTADPLPERAVWWRPGVGGGEGGDRGSRVRNQRSKVRGRASRYSLLSTQYSVPRPKRRRSSPTPGFPTPDSALLRPLVLHSPPLAIAAVSIAPDGPLVSFRLQGQQHQVVHQWGPERIETGWWRGTSVRRDYWRVETSTGQRFWLFRNLGDGSWHIHGEYA
jgi:protein ImuB